MPAALVFDKYEVVKRIAAGGMGEVFLARQQMPPGSERHVILKGLLPLAGAAAELNARRFLDEARLAAKLNHPNVVSLYEAGPWGGRLFIAMEYIPGWNLAQLMRRSHALQLAVDPWVVAQMIRDAARGLHHAHEAPDADGRPLGIVHRDVSPQNIIVRSDGLTKVVDFGVAGALGRGAQTEPGTIVGRAAYLAPEQLLGDAVDARSDQYALGVVFWELLTARRLHGGKRADLEIAKAVLSQPVPHPATLVPGLPPALTEVAMRMLAPAPARRFPRCEDVALALDEALRARPQVRDDLVALLERLGPVPAESAPPAPRRARWVPAALAAGALARVGALFSASPRPAAPGFLSIRTDPWTSVKIDGQAVGPTPLNRLELPAGVHHVELVNASEGIDHPMDLRIAPGEVRDVVLARAQLK